MDKIGQRIPKAHGLKIHGRQSPRKRTRLRNRFAQKTADLGNLVFEFRLLGPQIRLQRFAHQFQGGELLAQAIMLLSRMAFWFGPRRSDDDSGSNGLVAILVMILGPIAAFMLQMAVSRSREYEADAYSAHITGRPDQLASALGRLDAYNQQVPMRDAQPATAHMMIVNPLRGGGIRSLFSTHPPLAKRIERL